jgi:hypothetical protein
VKIRYLVGLLLMLLAACTPGDSASSGALPLAEDKPTLFFFYTDA